MMVWIKNNAGWLTSALAAMVIVIGWMSGAFGYVVATEAKPVIKEQIRIHQLEMEPRWVAIEMRQETLEIQSTESLRILRKLDPDNQ